MRLLFTTISLIAVTALCMASVPEKSIYLPGVDADSMRVRLDESDLQPMEGIWYYPNEEMTLGIERYQGAHNVAYRIIFLGGIDPELLPGTVIGYIAPTAVKNKFQLWLYSQRDHLTLLKPMECVATLNNDASSLTFDPPHWRIKVRVNLARFLPTIFRSVSIIPEKEEEKVPIGFNKVYPEGGNGNPFTTIRYL